MGQRLRAAGDSLTAATADQCNPSSTKTSSGLRSRSESPTARGNGTRRRGYRARQPHHRPAGITRADAFRAAIRTHGLRTRKGDIVECDGYSVAAGFAVGALGALRADDLRCPEDVSVVGFNDMPFVDQLCPPLTTVRLPQYEVGVQAAQLLLDRLANPASTAKSIMLPVALVARGSTGPCRVRASLPADADQSASSSLWSMARMG